MLVNYLHIFHTDVYFIVQLSTDKAFDYSLIIQLDDVKQNIRGGYIDDTNNIDYGKFITPVNGTYQFIVTIMNKDSGAIYGELIINGVKVSQSYSGSNQHQITSDGDNNNSSPLECWRQGLDEKSQCE